jgi:hypothetical protein
MKAAEKKILNNYWRLIKSLSPAMQSWLLERLKEGEENSAVSSRKLKSSFGAWVSDESADELIENIRNSRYTDRKIEKL